MLEEEQCFWAVKFFRLLESAGYAFRVVEQAHSGSGRPTSFIPCL